MLTYAYPFVGLHPADSNCAVVRNAFDLKFCMDAYPVYKRMNFPAMNQ